MALKLKATSCKQMISTPAHVCLKISRTSSSFFVIMDSTMDFLMSCQRPSGDKLDMICTRTASKIAMQSVCRGIDISSSSSVNAGYLVRLIFPSIWQGRKVFTLPFCSISNSSSNMNFCHFGHHSSTFTKESTYWLITVGRHTGPSLFTARNVFVILSGIEINLFNPKVLSVMNSETILLFENLFSQASLTASRAGQPSVFINSLSCSNCSWLKTAPTWTSRSPGVSMKRSKSAISSA
mmetsp:Transcript_126094/g.223303  ORF Transcript_126094/g.223303 Transcript_126094/m.223303 type:complete len:238 (-) Transcript_126094:72-785(-)